MELRIIAHIHTDLPEKFGLPRQSGIVEGLTGYIDFMPGFRDPEAVRGIDGYDYLWLLWGFEVGNDTDFRATVRPPRLGGNTRMGVFATRSPFRPNHIGLSSVKLDRVELTETGPRLYVSGIDMRDNTPIYDIKPYLSYTDSHEGARSGFTDEVEFTVLEIDFPEDLVSLIPSDKRAALKELLKQDPRPSYIDDEDRVYGLSFAGYNIRFKVKGNILGVTEVKKKQAETAKDHGSV